jgi:hypothetical protein
VHPLPHHDSVGIKQEDTRVGDAPLVVSGGPPELGVVLVEVFVKDPELPDYTAPLIRQQGVGNALLG